MVTLENPREDPTLRSVTQSDTAYQWLEAPFLMERDGRGP